MVEPEPAVATVVQQYREVHQAMRKAIADLDTAALTWTPAPETSPISTLVVHTLGSEAAMLRLVRGLPSKRDRDAEFANPPDNAADLLARLDAADALLDEFAPAITAADLAAVRERPDRPNLSPQTGLYWLITNYGHAREHLAQLKLTRQLYEAAGGR